MLAFGMAGDSGGEEYGAPIQSHVDISYLVNGRRPIWMGPVIRYSVYETTRVEARFLALGGEIITVIVQENQPPGQYTLPWDGRTPDGLATFDGKYRFELFFDDEYVADFWIIAKSIHTFDES
jgi:hypothetical protein